MFIRYVYMSCPISTITSQTVGIFKNYLAFVGNLVSFMYS